MRNTYFVSDIHLADSNGSDAQAFQKFLKDQLPEARSLRLFLVGDIFDLWIGDHSYFQKKFAPIVASIGALVEAGAEIHFLEGNHDFHLKRFWEKRLGVIVHENGANFELDGKRFRVEHGDLINPDDRGYLFLRWFLRTWVMKVLALNLPSYLVQKIGERASRASRKYTSTAKEIPTEKMRSLIRKYAEVEYKRNPFDFMITGHVHVVDDVTIGNGRSINLGSWFDERRILRVAGSEVSFINCPL